MPGRTLLLLGSGPGIGVAIASTFSVRGFTHIALVSRNEERLKEDRDKVLDAIQERGYNCQVKTWACDIADLDALVVTLKEIENYGSLECVLFNAARGAGMPPLDERTEHIERDFRLTNLALYETAQWAVPIFKQAVVDRSPSFFVISTSLLWKEPNYDLFSLSMAKSAQRALVLSLHHYFGEDIHIALLGIGGVVEPGKKNLNPDNIAQKAWELYKQPRESWEREIEISG